MSKTYRYRNLSYPVADSTDVNFTVEFLSNGNEGQTVINVPGEHDPEIDNAGTTWIGKGSDLRANPTIAVSVISNPIPEEDTITIRYSINGQVIQEHTNPKSEEDRPTIILFISFPAV